MSATPMVAATYCARDFASAAARLLCAVATVTWPRSGSGNFAMSPAGVLQVLAVLLNAASPGSTTERELASLLGSVGASRRDVTKLVSSLLAGDESRALVFTSAVAMWSSGGVSGDLAGILGREFHAEVVGHMASSAAEVNEWASRATCGKISAVISQLPASCDEPGAVLVAGAVHFKGSFTAPFDAGLTQEADFCIVGGGGGGGESESAVEVEMMAKRAAFFYTKQDLYEAVQLQYGHDGRFVSYVILPSKSSDVRAITGAVFTNWEEFLGRFGASPTPGTLKMPKFTVEQSLPLRDVLSHFGAPTPFTHNAEFGELNHGRPAWVTEMQQKTFLKVDEQGAEAAAVTVAVVTSIALLPHDGEFYMEVNRPFLFVIGFRHRSEVTGDVEAVIPIFVSAINNPATTP
ncbi:proteinase inhibitor I4 serpin [Pelomyxa schiedti]|nr:proteinase inhibitor I4 serpin [Pelomyxa schiedti]